MPAILRLYEDTLSNVPDLSIRLSALPRMLFVVHGLVTIDDRPLADGETWHGPNGVTLRPGRHGVTVWRFELGPETVGDGRIIGSGIRSHEKIAARLAPLPPGELLMRGDSVAFPPGGCAYLHKHQGPGIRCLLDGGIRIDTDGHSTSYGPGGAWYEPGPIPVFAQAASDRPSRFIRLMILPKTLLGKTSIQYVNEDDKDKPKSQRYEIFVDAPIAFDGRG